MTTQVAKNVLINVSIGNTDRDHTVEDLYDAIRKVIPKQFNVVMVGANYVIDGKTCRPQDYDPKKHDFLPGRTPPEWAGGPKEAVVIEEPTTVEHKMLKPREALGHAPRSETSGRRTIQRRPRRA